METFVMVLITLTLLVIVLHWGSRCSFRTGQNAALRYKVAIATSMASGADKFNGIQICKSTAKLTRTIFSIQTWEAVQSRSSLWLELSSPCNM
ncbi:hypothetical protein M758_1G141700 [Ceratodon purpureus]|nr:hypothetical protein M758_1G141700 [Ceratodon purpureus]